MKKLSKKILSLVIAMIMLAPTILQAAEIGKPSFTPSNVQTVKKETEIQVKTENQETVQSDFVKVYVNKQFPSIVKYELASGKTMLGNTNLPEVVKIDDVEYKPTVTFTKESDKKANYVLTFDKINVEMTVAIEITNKADNGEIAEQERIISYKVTEIKENGTFKVHTIEMPENSIFTVSSEAAGGTFVGTTNQSDTSKSGDIFVDLSKKSTDKSALKYEYGIIYTSDVAASFRSNATSYEDGNRVLKQSKQVGDEVLTTMWSNKWTYRIPTYTKTFDDTRWDYTDRTNYSGGAVYNAKALTFPTTTPQPAKGSTIISQNAQTTAYPNVTVQYDDVVEMEKPVIEIVVTEDINGDSTVDWMDAAVAYRDIRYLPVGYQEIPKFAVQRLIHPHSSLGSYTFAESLDETKKVYLKTDGLDQVVLHKVFNYADWGDFTHYAENMGGYDGFKEFVDVATEDYKAFVGVHTNFTEVFAKSKNFRPETIEPGNGGYAGFGYWFHQVYTPDKTFEAITKERGDRLAGFKESLPNIAFIYSDVYTDKGLLERRLATDYEDAGLAHFVEWPYQSEERTIWSHWAVEKNYSPQNLMAYSSDVVRFMNNDIKDRWDNNKEKNIVNPRVPSSTRLLMGADTTAWEGWMASGTNLKYSEAMRKVFDNNIPTKFMQKTPITRWTRGTDSWVDHIWFEDGVEVYFDGDKTNDSTRERVIEKDGKEVYRGNAREGTRDAKYLIPWDIDDKGVFEEEGKLYHWNAKGGASTWELPNSWAGVASVKVYELTDQGKENEVVVPVTDGKVTITASKEVPYVVYKGDATPVNEEVNYGEGSLVKDPGFNAGKLGTNWIVATGTASVVKDETTSTNGGQVGYELLMGSGNTEVTQKITGLEAGETYAVSVMTEVEPGKERHATLQVDAVTTEQYTINSSKHMEANVMSTKAGTKMLPIRVTFEAPSNGEITLWLKAGTGDARVKFDNIRLYRSEVPENLDYAGSNVLLYQDFEYVPTGYVSEQHVTKASEYLPTYEGYYPFFMSGSIREPKYIIEQLNAPFTQNGADDPWDKKTAIVDEVIAGRNSFKAVGAPVGLFISTSPSTVQFTPGKEYRVTFSYEAQPAADYAVAVGSEVGKIDDYDVLLPTSKPTIYTKTFVATSADQWVGFSRVAITDSSDPTPFVLDNVLIELVGDGVVKNEQVQEDIYEFEDATLVDGPTGNKVEIKANANDSGGKHVEIFESVGASLTFNNINVDSDGLYTLTFDYGAGYNSRKLVVNVNGEEQNVSFPKTSGWGYPWSQKSIDVELKSGTNSVAVSIISPNGLNEDQFGRVNLDCLRVTKSKSHNLQGSIYERLLAENLLDYNEINTQKITIDKDAAQGTRVIIPADDAAKMEIKGIDYGYGAGGISFNIKSAGNGTIKATSDGEELGTLPVSASNEYSVQHLAFSKQIAGYKDIELEFNITGGTSEISWVQFSEQREAEDAFLENGARIRLGGGGTGRGYINEFEVGGYNPTKAPRAVKFSIDSDIAQVYDLDIQYALSGNRVNAFTVKVNGETQSQLDFDSTGGWSTWKTKTIQVQLEKGSNIVSLSTEKDADGNFINTGATNIDWVRFRPSGEQSTRDASVLIEAESYDNTFETTKTVSDAGTFVSGGDTSWIDFEKVKFSGDLDLLEIRTSEDSAGEVEVFVGGTSIGKFAVNAGETLTTFEVPTMANETLPIRVEFIGENAVKLDSFRFLKKASEVKIEGDKTTLYVNEETTLTATVLPENVTSKNVVWSSSDSSIAVVSQKGLVLGVKKGNVDIIATSADGKAAATYTIAVEDPTWINAQTTFEAEDSELSGGAKVNNNHAGYSGTGFVDGFYKPNYYAGATFTVNAPANGTYLVAVRYSCNMSDNDDRNSGIEVNGQRLSDRLIFTKTGGWNKWKNIFVEVDLNKGNNTIAIKLDSMTMGDLGDFNLDFIAVKGVDVATVVDKTALAAKIAEVEAIEKGNHTDDSWNLLQAAHTSAKAVNDNGDALQTEVDNALAALEAAVTALEEKETADKDALAAAITSAEALDSNAYTAESWADLQTALDAAKAVNENTEATQSEVDNALASLNGAIASLVDKPDVPVDKALLQAKIAQAAALTESSYTAESWAVLATELVNSKAVEANDEATQEEVEQAVTALTNAMNALQTKPVVEADKTALKAAIASAEALDENVYTSESWNTLQIALGAAKATDSKIDASQDQVDGALLTLNSAIACLVNKPDVTVDKALLQAKIAQAEALTENVYTTESWATVASELANAKAIEAKTDATQEEVAQAVTSLTDAIASLEKKPTAVVDKSILNQTIAVVEAIEKGNYTDESWNTLQIAITNAKGISANPVATQTEVDNAVNTLTTAKDALQEKPSTVVDKALLKQKIDSATTIEKGNYTDESWNSLQTALSNANSVYNKADATQEEVNNAHDALNAAVVALQEKPAPVDKTNLNNLIKQAEAIQKGNYTDASWNTLQQELANAKNVAAKTSATQIEVQLAEKALQGAILGLAVNDVTTNDGNSGSSGGSTPTTQSPADKSSLNNVLKDAAKIKQGSYSSGSWTALQNVIENAKNCMNRSDVSQAEVNSHIVAINNAIAALKVVRVSKNDSNNTNKTPAASSAISESTSSAGSSSVSSATSKEEQAASSENTQNANSSDGVSDTNLSNATSSGSSTSSGNVWIIIVGIAAALAVVIAISALVYNKKKRASRE